MIKFISAASAIVLVLGLALSSHAASAAPGQIRSVQTERFYTLGTGGGPIPHATRAQPANLLMIDHQGILIDVGDGATSQLGRVGVPVEDVKALFISHLHFDHTAGLLGFLSRRFQMAVPGEVTIYGPPGTRAMVDGVFATMRPALGAWSNLRQRSTAPLDAMARVVEIEDGWHGVVAGVPGVTAIAASNTHYASLPDSAGVAKMDTYAFRFETARRAIVYTGDTGPSPAVARLAHNADFLFAEIIDADGLLARLARSRPDISAAALATIADHYRREHLSPAAVGELAREAGAKALIIIHNGLSESGEAAARKGVRHAYRGSLKFANDLDVF